MMNVVFGARKGMSGRKRAGAQGDRVVRAFKGVGMGVSVRVCTCMCG